MLERAARLGLVVLVAATAGGCWASDDVEPDRAQATAVEQEEESSSPTPADGESPSAPPSPSSSPSPSPTASSTPSEPPSPSPSASASDPSDDESPPAPDPEPEQPDETAEPITAEDAVAAAARWRSRNEQCIDDELVDTLHRVVAEVGDSFVVHAICFLGAYQTSGRMLRYDGDLTEIPVEQWVGGSVTRSPEVVGDVLDVGGGRLENVQLYRGIGDCGVAQLWRPSASGLTLVEAREQQCDVTDDPLLPPDWPVVYRR